MVSKIPEEAQRKFGVRAAYFIVEVTTGRLNKITELFDDGILTLQVGAVLSLADALWRMKCSEARLTSAARLCGE